MRIDDDEVVSPGLLEQLPGLMDARDVLQYWVTRRWLYPDAGHWLDEWPWFPDFQGRLVRNDARTWLPGLCHSSVAFARPARYLDTCIYHLQHLDRDREERECKVARYRALDPALRARELDPYLSAYYLPERHPRARVTPVPAADQPVIDAVLSPAAAPSGSAAGSEARLVSGEEIHSHWPERALDSAAYRATIVPVDRHRHLSVRDRRPFRICVRNDGSERWPGGEDRRPLIRVAYRWLRRNGVVVTPEGARTPLPHSVGPDESCLVAMNVSALPLPGRYLLVPDLVHEGVRWFECESSPLQMIVTPEQEPIR
jgi:hypothetical protein